MPAPNYTPVRYSAAAERIFKEFALPLNLSLEELIEKEINENGRAVRDLAPEWGCSVSLLSQIISQLGGSVTRHSRVKFHPRAERR